MSCTVNYRFQMNSSPHEQGADSFWCIQFVPGNREKVDTERVDVGVDLADRLCGVGVEQDAMFSGNLGASGNRLDRSDLIVGMHDAGENRSRCDCRAKILHVDLAPGVN